MRREESRKLLLYFLLFLTLLALLSCVDREYTSNEYAAERIVTYERGVNLSSLEINTIYDNMDSTLIQVVIDHRDTIFVELTSTLYGYNNKNSIQIKK